MTNTHEHLEHAEHAQHAAHDPFSARVALTIAIIAGVLAVVTVLSHQAHNDTIQYQIEAGILQTQASDQWAFYQAKNIRDHEYEAYIPILDAVAKESGKEGVAGEARKHWADQRTKYKAELKELSDKAKSLEEQSKAKAQQSHFVHEKGNRFDLGELAVELGLVLCSVAVLMKRAAFWYGGMAAAAVGVVVALSVVFLTPHAEAHDYDTAATEHHAPEKTPGH
jgi:hypothetical protein